MLLAPSFPSNSRQDAVLSVPHFMHPQAISLQTHIHNAILAGGVAVGPSCHLITTPWLAMLLGFMAGLISIGGALCLPVRSWATDTWFGLDQQGPGSMVGHHVVPWAAVDGHRHLLRQASKLG